MSISEKIKTAQDEIVSMKDQLTEATMELEANPDDENSLVLVEELSEKINRSVKSLEALQKAEQALASKASPVIQTGGNAEKTQAPAYVRHPGTNAKGNAADLLIKSAVVAFESGVRRVSAEQVLQERYPNMDEVKAVTGIVVKAAQPPAMTTSPSWAGELVREGYGAFMDLLRGESAVAKLNLQSENFDGVGSIKIPVRQASANNLAGAFRAEGSPIRVGSMTLGSITLTPKSMAVIGTFTNELLQRSTTNIESTIRNAMVADTATVLDTLFFDAVAGSAVRPAGLQNGLVAPNTAASAGATLANIQADLKARLSQMATLNMGRRPVWVMHPSSSLALAMTLTATGTAAFPSMSNGVLVGIPVVTSTNMPSGVVFLLDQAEIAIAAGAPEFSFSDVASIHEEDTAPAPLDGATPVRSLWQTNSAGLRSIWTLDWASLRVGSVQSITGVSW